MREQGLCVVYMIEENVIPEIKLIPETDKYKIFVNSKDFYISPNDRVIFNSLKRIIQSLTITKTGKLYTFKDMVKLEIFTKK
jgi:hypothetical protein